MIKNFRDFMVRWKFRISYFSGFLTTFAAILIISSTVQEKMGFIGLALNYIIVLVLVFVGIIIGAFIFDKYGFIESEIEYANSKNTLLKEIHKK